MSNIKYQSNGVVAVKSDRKNRFVQGLSRQVRGSTYVLVLMVSMMVTVIGLSALTASRVQQRSVSGSNDFALARDYALCAIDMGLFAIEQDPTSWRNTFTSPGPPTNVTFGGGLLSLQVVDPGDGSLTNNTSDPIAVTGIGEVGSARVKLQVTVTVDSTSGEASFHPGTWKRVVD